ncbi:heterokaryon incompatibility protein-domain-containing protein [Cladorrhinum sp. PSN259]|nr:heterokaryon incompatibility protein-domain-containing protein [Cladorrhinum sp. PSN259]
MHHQKSCCPVPDPKRNMLSIKPFDCWTRSIIIRPDGHDYVALSYVWGNTSEPDSTGLTNSLPNTIEDAITTTQKLGFRYLWIDRYCIDQSSTEEKATQIEQMDLIYGNASCTIIAAAGADPSAGLPGVSFRTREPRSYTTTWTGCSYVSVPRDPILDIKDSV